MEQVRSLQDSFIFLQEKLKMNAAMVEFPKLSVQDVMQNFSNELTVKEHKMCANLLR